MLSNIIWKWRFEITGFVLSFWGLFLRFSCLLHRELWLDEKYSLSFIVGPLKPLLWKIYYNGEQIYFPGYYYLTWPFVQIFGNNKWGINTPHILATVIGFYIFYLLCRRYIKFWIPFTVAFLLYVHNYNLVYHAFEFRPYAILIVLSISILFYLERLMEGAYAHWSKKAILLFFIAFSIVYHPYSLLMVILSSGYLLWREKAIYREKQWKDFLKFSMICLLISSLIFIWYALGTVQRVNLKYDVFQYIANPTVNVVQFVKDILGNLIGGEILLKLLFWIGIIGVFMSNFKKIAQYIVFFALFIALPIQLILLADLSKGYWFLQRQFVWVIPYFCILIGCMWDGIFHRLKGIKKS